MGSVVENGLLETSCAWSRCAWGREGKSDTYGNLESSKIPEGFSFGVFVCVFALQFCFALFVGVGLAGSNWELYAIPLDPGLTWMVEGRQVAAGPPRPAPLSCACFPADARRAVAGDGSAATR